MLGRVFFPQCGNHFRPSFSQFVVHSYGHLCGFDATVGAVTSVNLAESPTLAALPHLDRIGGSLRDGGPLEALHMVLLALLGVCHGELHQILEFSVMLRTFYVRRESLSI